ncbi:DUF2778 domain-containing protein [Jiella sp. KSK16Y-1]|uniref:DUF2778 domain-containing protein n=2 Tax=Jiella mangrovi TaxID=2821407 RepID=A0ABS4BGN1_9HYPH|nr:DUF2778 domain-containing protein [Jiella mangrovi]
MATATAKPGKTGFDVAALTKQPERSADARLRSIPKAIEAEVAADTDRTGSIAVKPSVPPVRSSDSEPSQNALARLASFDPQPSSRAALAGTGVAAYQASPDVPRPSLRPEIEAEIATEAAEPAQADVIASVPLPVSRPETQPGREVRVASLEPDDMPGPLGTATEEMTELAVPLPERRPNYQPPVVASPQAQPQQATRPAERQAPAVASTPPSAPGRDVDTGGSFFERLFGGGGTAKLPPAHLGVAVYDISAQTVYLPGEGKLEAHSGLGHMQDKPRYVAQKNRGPTPPNVYNLRMREARFHGAEAIRLLPADGRKKYNRDGLLAHPYMYIGGGDRSQSNGCVVFKHYDRFLAAFKRGRIKKMIVVPSLDELPTYMAAL